MFTITGNQTETLVVDLNGSDLHQLLPGDSVALIPYWTLGTLFPDGQGIQISSSPANRSTEVLFPDISAEGINLSAARTCYFFNGAWRQVGHGVSIKNDDVLPPDGYMWIRHNTSTSTEIPLKGSVLPTRCLHLRRKAGARQDNLVALPRSFSVALNASGLLNGGAFGASADVSNRSDELFVFDNSAIAKNKSAAWAYYYRADAWHKVGSANANVGSDFAFRASAGAVLRTGGVSLPSIWTNNRGY